MKVTQYTEIRSSNYWEPQSSFPTSRPVDEPVIETQKEELIMDAVTTDIGQVDLSPIFTPEQQIEQLQAENARLKRELRFKQQFVGGMNHELRTPLNAILGLTEALEEQIHGELNARQLRLLKGIDESGRHLLHLIGDVVNIAKLDADVTLNVQRVSAESILDSTIRLIKQDAHRKGVHLTHHITPNIGVFVVDAHRITQMLLNLLDNAMKATSSGGKVALNIVGDTESNVIHFKVSDSGTGMSMQQVDQLFQAENDHNRGLALVRKLAGLHGGTLDVSSTEGVGSEFVVTLPWRSLVETETPTAHAKPLPKLKLWG